MFSSFAQRLFIVGCLTGGTAGRSTDRYVLPIGRYTSRSGHPIGRYGLHTGWSGHPIGRYGLHTSRSGHPTSRYDRNSVRSLVIICHTRGWFRPFPHSIIQLFAICVNGYRLLLFAGNTFKKFPAKNYFASVESLLVDVQYILRKKFYLIFVPSSSLILQCLLCLFRLWSPTDSKFFFIYFWTSKK